MTRIEKIIKAISDLYDFYKKIPKIQEDKFVICVNNDSDQSNLVIGKVYQTIPDAKAEALNMICVIDEDKSKPIGRYYPAEMFEPVKHKVIDKPGD